MKEVIIIIILFSMFSCKKENMGDCFKGTGDIISEQRNLEYSDSIKVDNNINLILTYGTGNKIVIEAGKNLVPLIKAEVRNGFLHLENTNKCNFMRSFKVPVNVYIESNRFSKIVLNGTGNITSTNSIKSDYLIVDNIGTGDFNIEIDANYVHTHIHGSGDIIIKGRAELQEAYCAGYAYIRAEGLITNYTYVYSNTSGDVIVNAENELGAQIYNSGNVYYKGSPKVSYILSEGTGNLLPLDK
jgi:hypothetical protein